jgi:arsenate reductase-like glutaredoxin family protein
MESKGFDVERVLKNYDKPIRENWVITKEGIKRKPKDSVILGDGYDVLDLDDVTGSLYESKFPAKYDAETSGAYKAGRAAGERLLDFGGRIEPMTKTGWSITGGVKTPENDYKKSDWYAKMSDNKKKLVDEAFKQKAMEREFEELVKEKPEDEAFKQKAMEREFEELVKEKPEAVRRAQMDIPDRDLKNPLTEKEYELVMAMRKRGFEKMLGGEQ